MNVLLAIDGSAESIAAAAFLVSLPLPTKPTIHVLMVMQDFTNSEIPIVRPEDEERRARESFDRVRAILEPAGHAASYLTERGHPSSTILDTAEATDADLIVLGSIGHNAVYRIVLGSTADYVANNAPCSVLLVRPDVSGQSELTRFRVMLAYDGSPYSKIASREMFSLEWSAETDHIQIAMMLGRPKLIPEEELYDPEAIKDAEETLPKLRQSDASSCEVTYTIRETTDVSDALLDISTQKNINLMFVGPAGKSGLSRFFLGSTSRYLLRHTSCSVWIARKKNK